MWWLTSKKGPSGFSSKSTAEEVTQGIDGSGLTAIVTGATSRIGAETARVLALRGVHVVMGVRNIAAAKNVKEAIIRENPAAKLDAMEVDLSSLESVRNFASNFQASGLSLNILVNNAGCLTSFKLSKDNIELVFATNHLGHFLLTNLLLETMKKTALMSGREGRVVNVSSEGYRLTYHGGIRFDKVNDKSGHRTCLSYGQSKLANILHANELARRLKEDRSNITANSIHPGMVATELVRFNKNFVEIAKVILAPFVKNVQQGAATTCYVALHPDVQGLSGEYFADSNIRKLNSQARDVNLAEKLWDFSIKLVKKDL